jgi:hypothetical protein
MRLCFSLKKYSERALLTALFSHVTSFVQKTYIMQDAIANRLNFPLTIWGSIDNLCPR